MNALTGLSSSAAICVLIAKCFNEVYKLGLEMSALMEAAYRGEMMTPSRCGRMDQCVVMGAGSIGLMDFDGEDCHLRIIACNQPLHFVVADLKASKDTVKILGSLQECFPFPLDSTQVHTSCLLMCVHLYVHQCVRASFVAYSL